ncbi:dUTP diphosphatase [soil metagenome]
MKPTIERALQPVQAAFNESLSRVLDAALVRAMGSPTIEVALTEEAEAAGVQRPKMSHASDAGMDIAAWFPAGDEIIEPGESLRIPTGLVIAVTHTRLRRRQESRFDFPAIVECRTGLALNHGIVPGPRIFDTGYRPDKDDPHGWTLGLRNVSNEPYTISNGHRVAQLIFPMVLRPAAAMRSVELAVIDFGTDRGAGRFASTGL